MEFLDVSTIKHPKRSDITLPYTLIHRVLFSKLRHLGRLRPGEASDSDTARWYRAPELILNSDRNHRDLAGTM